MAQIYKIFAEGWTGLDFSDSSLIEMYNSESYGEPIDERKNGFYVGKHWMDVTISMWSELYNDPRFPSDWLDAVLR
jgi:hypothetical protein